MIEYEENHMENDEKQTIQQEKTWIRDALKIHDVGHRSSLNSLVFHSHLGHRTAREFSILRPKTTLDTSLRVFFIFFAQKHRENL